MDIGRVVKEYVCLESESYLNSGTNYDPQIQDLVDFSLTEEGINLDIARAILVGFNEIATNNYFKRIDLVGHNPIEVAEAKISQKIAEASGKKYIATLTKLLGKDESKQFLEENQERIRWILKS